jgi:hypothetical protein
MRRWAVRSTTMHPDNPHEMLLTELLRERHLLRKSAERKAQKLDDAFGQFGTFFTWEDTWATR